MNSPWFAKAIRSGKSAKSTKCLSQSQIEDPWQPVENLRVASRKVAEQRKLPGFLHVPRSHWMTFAIPLRFSTGL
jgi:hypothetical protein